MTQARTPAPLPEKSYQTTPEHPWPLRVLSQNVQQYVSKMAQLWVEAQIAQINRRPGTATTFMTLRDPDVDMSFSVSIPTRILEALPTPISEGERIVARVKPSFWSKRGTLQLEATDLRPVGIGDLHAQLERLKQLLRQEGLFAEDRKRPLPFLPRRVGLVTGRNSAAMKDVVENARRRWPQVVFVIHEVAVQGNDAVPQVVKAVAELDRVPDVDVIVIARGGGSFEDLLPFSNEALVRAVANAFTPIVSAIGHDPDTPLLDYVADLRASTPTDAAKRIVPDAQQELASLAHTRERARRHLAQSLLHESRRITDLRSRPVITAPATTIVIRQQEVAALRERSRQVVTARISRAEDQTRYLRAQVRALSPQGVLDRGYAVVRRLDGSLVTDQSQISPAEILRVTVARGDFGVTVIGDETPTGTGKNATRKHVTVGNVTGGNVTGGNATGAEGRSPSPRPRKPSRRQRPAQEDS